MTKNKKSPKGALVYFEQLPPFWIGAANPEWGKSSAQVHLVSAILSRFVTLVESLRKWWYPHIEKAVMAKLTVQLYSDRHQLSCGKFYFWKRKQKEFSKPTFAVIHIFNLER